jgi:two-component sensor histidine kinase
VKEGQNRVKSMALIHQRLYSADDIRGVDVQDYLENLTSELFTAFGVDNEKIIYQLESQGIKLDIDTIIPLGLILNELITNTLKYAFQKSEEGLLQIKIQEIDNKLQVIVQDDGIGMDEAAIESSNSFGWKMINSLGRKLKAEIKVINEGGTTVLLTLNRYKLIL